MAAQTDGKWQVTLSELARDWGSSEVELLNEAVSDLHTKYDKKKKRVTGRTAMIVDDSAMMRLMMEEWLNKAGINIAARAENGFEAVKLFNGGERYDYVFLNVVMPSLDGVDALTDFKKDHNSTIIMVTSTKLPELLLRSIKCGAHHILYRPFDYSSLLAVLCADSYFSPETHDVVAGTLHAMGIDGKAHEMTQDEVFKLAALAALSQSVT